MIKTLWCPEVQLCNSWLKTICANPDLDSECFTAANAGASTHQQAASIMQGAANMRIAAGCGSGDFGGIFFNRDRHRLDGDISQAFTEQSTMGIQEFDLFDPDYGTTEADVIENLTLIPGQTEPPMTISFLLENFSIRYSINNTGFSVG